MALLKCIFQNFLQDIESKKPKLEEVLTTAQTLHRSSSNEDEKKILKEKGKLVRSPVCPEPEVLKVNSCDRLTYGISRGGSRISGKGVHMYNSMGG